MTTDFEKIYYNAKAHTYQYGDQMLMPVTSVVKRLTPEFDSDSVLASKMVETGRSKSDIQAEWDAKRDYGLDRGTRVHSYIENVLDGIDQRVLMTINDPLHEMNQFDMAWTKLQSNLSAVLYKKEWTLGDAELGIAGRTDAVLDIMVEGQNQRCLFDWKTGKFMTRKYARETMLPPFDDLPHCEEVKYSIQLSLYRLLIERNLKESYQDGYLLHLPDNKEYQLHKVIDLRSRLEAWLLDLRAKGELGDPDSDKKGERAGRAIDSVDEDLLKVMSPQARRQLLSKTLKLLNRGRKYLA